MTRNHPARIDRRRFEEWAATRPTLMTTGEVAEILRVDPRTVRTWANAGKLRVFVTPGGTRRYYLAQVLAIGDPSPANKAAWAKVLATLDKGQTTPV